MRPLGVAIVGMVAVCGIALGHAGAWVGSADAVVAPAQSLTIGDLRVQRRAPGGRVRGSVAATPGGAALEVVLRRAGRRVGSGRLTAAGSGTTRFSVRLNRANRARLSRTGSLRLNVDVRATTPGSRVSTSQDVRVTR